MFFFDLYEPIWKWCRFRANINEPLFRFHFLSFNREKIHLWEVFAFSHTRLHTCKRSMFIIFVLLSVCVRCKNQVNVMYSLGPCVAITTTVCLQTYIMFTNEHDIMFTNKHAWSTCFAQMTSLTILSQTDTNTYMCLRLLDLMNKTFILPLAIVFNCPRQCRTLMSKSWKRAMNRVFS